MKRLISPMFWLLLLITAAEEVTWYIPFLAFFIWAPLVSPRIALHYSYAFVRYFYEAKRKIPQFTPRVRYYRKKKRCLSPFFWILVVAGLVEVAVFVVPMLSILLWLTIIFPGLGLMLASFFDKYYEDVTGIPVTEAKTRVWKYLESRDGQET